MNNKIITGITKRHGRCLICICGAKPEEELERMLNNPTKEDLQIIAGATDLEIKEVPEKDCWWNGKLD